MRGSPELMPSVTKWLFPGRSDSRDELDHWLGARPPGTEDVYRLYAESFKGSNHLRRIQEEALAVIQNVFREGQT